MLNVLLVDDESLIRNGLKYSINWNDFGLCVAYEASCVDEAISLLRRHDDIRLVFTDVVMPGKNGIELLRHIRNEAPSLPVVVLTYHNDFSYIRDALRLGAIDYIIKTELEPSAYNGAFSRIAQTAKSYDDRLNKEIGEETNNRIVDRIDDRIGGEVEKGNSSDPQDNIYPQAIYICSPALTLPEGIEYEKSHLNGGGTLFFMHSSFPNESLVEFEKQLNENDFLLVINGTIGKSVSDVINRANFFISYEYFYSRLPNLLIYEIDAICPDIEPIDSTKLREIRIHLNSFSWIGNDTDLRQILAEIPRACLSPAIIYDLFYDVFEKWQQMFNSEIQVAKHIALSNFKFWYQWVDWIANLRQQLYMSSGFMRYSPEISDAIRKLLLLLGENPAKGLDLAEAAAYTNISESYFTKCFKEITGCTYMEYLRNLRIEFGGKLLLQTKLPVSRVAELCGLPDPFHFSKLFKKYYGQPPSVYRDSHAK